MKGILTGKHYNRCKQVHVVVALAMKVLHFNSFLEQCEETTNEKKLSVNEIAEMLEDENSYHMNTEDLQKNLQDTLDEYSSYTRETMNGTHGYTAKFALMYVSFIEWFQLFEHSIRTSDIDLYIYSAFKMCSLFFTFNHQNYARWLSRNLDDLMNIETTHPGLKEEFSSGALSIRRTKKNFCRSAVDLTLEQTINANAANKLTGISAFTNSLDARQKWSETHTIRTAVISELIKFLGLDTLNENEGEYKNKIFKDRLVKFTQEIGQNINPFNSDLNREKLFNLSSGKAASSETAEFLLKVDTNGFEQMETFIKECQVDKNRFERPIRKNVIRNFSNETSKNKHSSVKNITDVKAERNILGQALCLALKKEIDLASVLSHPLTAVPHSLAHFDGTMLSLNQKAELTTVLVSKLNLSNSSNQSKFDVDLIDGLYLLNSLREVPVKYGQLANMVLQIVCSTSAREIHLIFHKNYSPSPADVYMKKYKELFENSTVNFKIKGPNQARSTSLKNCLTSIDFRNELVKFFVDHWSKDAMCVDILNEKRVYLSFGKSCYLFSNQYEKGKILASFENNHFEIESKIIFHLSKIRESNIRVKIENPDTILVYLLYHIKGWPKKEVWIETGDTSKNTLRQINVRQIFAQLNSNLIEALPAWYVFTGCAYEPSFYGKGKKTCLRILEKSIQFQEAFGKFGTMVGEDEEKIIEQFTCQLYGSKDNDVNLARVNIFLKGYGSADVIDFKKNGKTRCSFAFYLCYIVLICTSEIYNYTRCGLQKDASV